jgi:hypothetical protein
MQESSNDPRLSLLSILDVERSRVKLSASHIVLLCGGKTAPLKNNPNDPDPPWQSLRDAINRTVITCHNAYEIFIPEDLKSWQADGIYKDLVTFETDLASICSLVVIVLETEGSIAELAAFSQLSELRNKIVALRSGRFSGDESFINLGILRYVSEHSNGSVKSYPWAIGRPGSITVEVVDDVISDIGDELDKLKKSEALNLEKGSHIAILICEIVSLFMALKESEIFGYLKAAGVNITSSALKSRLFLLEHFRLIRKQEYSGSIFYVQGSYGYHKITLKDKEDKALFRSVWKSA